MNMEQGEKYRSLWLRVGYATVREGYVRRLGVRAFVVFVIIRTYMNKEGVAFPSLTRIAYLSGCNVRTVQKEIKKLEQEGWIRKRKTRTLGGRYERNRYEILENDLIRGTGEQSFVDHPVEKNTNGDEADQGQETNNG